MMEARLNNLLITNFRSLRGTVAIPLDAPIVLVHGSNGMGKTSMLSAIEIALTGEITHLERADREYRKHLLHRGTPNGSIKLFVNGEMFPNARGEADLKLQPNGPEGAHLLVKDDATFFSERCYLAQVTLGRLFELYQDKDVTDKTTPLTKFVKDLLGLDQLDALTDGLNPAFHIARIRNLVPEFRRFVTLQTELRHELQAARAREAELRRLRDESRSSLTRALAALYTPEHPVHALVDRPGELRSVIENDAHDDAELVDLTRARGELSSLAQRWAGLPTGLAAEERTRAEADERQARDAYLSWVAGPGQQLDELVRGLTDIFPDLPSPTASDPENARMAAETRVNAEKGRCDRVLATARAAEGRMTLLDQSIQRANARRAELDNELAGLPKDAEGLASVLANLAAYTHDEICPVCRRDFSEVKSGPLSAHVAGLIASLTSQAGRLRAVAQQRAELTGVLGTAERNRLSVEHEVLASADFTDVTVRRARLDEAAAKLAALAKAAQEGTSILRRQAVARDSLARARRHDELATELRSEIARWSQILVERPLEQFASIEAGLSALSTIVNERLQALDSRLMKRRQAIAQLNQYVDQLTNAERLEDARKKIEERVSSLLEVGRKVDATRECAKAIANAARSARTNIVGRVFNESLNKMWRDLFVRLAPYEEFVPVFKLPTRDDEPVEARLETVDRSGERAGPPGTMLSAGNLNTGALTLFLALHLCVQARLPWLILDDPVQSMDDVHISQFAALLRSLAKTRHRQIIIAVHDRALFDYLTLELGPAFQDDRLITVELSRTYGGDSVATPTVFTYRPDQAIAA